MVIAGGPHNCTLCGAISVATLLLPLQPPTILKHFRLFHKRFHSKNHIANLVSRLNTFLIVLLLHYFVIYFLYYVFFLLAGHQVDFIAPCGANINQLCN